ncbi:MAG: SDR family oxidoreductase [Candidatus Eisenbacteria sp.]|nr:SDR family oxidoreductase [Candidatus Eisenbacteria bacterium]
MKTVLVTGGSGALGWALVRRLHGRCRVVATFCRHRFHWEDVEGHRLDLQREGQAAALIRDVKPDCVVHTASLTKVDYCEEHPDETEQINVRGTGEIARATQKIGARLVYISTDLVFDGEKGQYVESDGAKPLSVYGKSKLKGEVLAERHCKNSVILRSALIYGWGSQWNPTFLEWIYGRLSDGQETRLFTDQYRSPVYIEDLVEAIERVMLVGPVGLFHLGGRVRLDRLTFGRRMCEIFGFSENLLIPTTMDEHPYVAPRPLDCSLDSSKFHFAVGHVFGGVEAGLRSALESRELAGP